MTEKLADQEQLEAALKDADLLQSTVDSIDQQTQLPVTAILSLDEANSELENCKNYIDQLKTELRKTEDSRPHGLDSESLAQLKSAEELAKLELEKLDSRAKELEKQASLIGQLEGKQNEAENQLKNLSADVDLLAEKYAQGPVPLLNVRFISNRQNSKKIFPNNRFL